VRYLHEAGRKPAGVGLAAVAAALLIGSVALRAQQAPPAQAAARPMVPMAASSLLRNPDAHIGANVSLMAAVETILSKSAFTVDQDRTKAAEKDLLIIAPNLNAAPDLNAYVTVQGEVFKFDVAEIAKRSKTYKLDLTPEQIAKYQGRPAIFATSVISPAMVDLAKRVLPPPTAAELEFRKAMLAINPAFMALRGGLDTPNAALLKEQVATLKKSFGDVEAFFKTKGTADAAAWAGDAVKLATTMEQAVVGAKFDDVRTAAGSMQQLCAQCHGVHRERQDDGTFRIKG
jgi:hypothetical protein